MSLLATEPPVHGGHQHPQPQPHLHLQTDLAPPAEPQQVLPPRASASASAAATANAAATAAGAPSAAGSVSPAATGIRARFRRHSRSPSEQILQAAAAPPQAREGQDPDPDSAGPAPDPLHRDPKKSHRISWPNLLMNPYCGQTQSAALHCFDSFTNSQPHQMLFTHSASLSSPAPPAGLSSSTSTNTAASTSPPTSRSSRLRRFSHLRSYTPSHLLSRDSGSSTSSSGGDGLTRSASEFNAAVPRSAQPSSTSGADPSRNRNRLTLVNSVPVPSRADNPQSSTTTTTAAATATTGNTTNTSTPNASSSADSAAPAPAASAEPAQPTPLAENPRADISAPAAQGPHPQDVSDHSQSSSPNPQQQEQEQEQQDPPTMTRTRASTTGDTGAAAAATAATNAADFLPSLRLSAYYDPRSTRPSLTFPPVSRTLPTGTESIRVGRYSERDSQSVSNLPNNQPSAAPVGFKSKVVSRRHCEFWYENGKWFIKDVKSSSGTFLNHIRLSPPSQESKAFPVNDGDIVQLGIDFKGGEEMIFRCVKMRIELNRGWQNKLNTFNMAAHQRLRKMASSTPAGSAAGSTSQDCSICLNSIAPCQSLFVAPCSHTWHFKCVRSLLTSPQYPIFICPNCRAGADLEADVDDPAEDWEQLEAEGENGDKSSVNGAPLAPSPASAPAEQENSIAQDTDAMDVTVNLGASDSPTGRGNLPHATSEPLPITNPASGSGRASSREHHTPSPTNGHEGPITPRNEAGPWVFDGSAGQRRGADGPDTGMRSLDAAADMNLNGDSSDSSMR